MRGQVAFGEFDCTQRRRGSLERHAALLLQNFTERSRHHLHPPHLVGVATQLRLVGDFFEQRQAVAQWNLLVGVPEKFGIGKACPQHALVPMPNHSITVAVNIQHGNKPRLQVPLLVFHREIFLVVPHYRNQDFARQREESLLKAAHNRVGPLGRVHDPLLELGIRHDPQANIIKYYFNLCIHCSPALGRIKLDAICAELLRVLRKTPDHQRSPA